MRLSKHHGLGNDFLVVLDQGSGGAVATAELARRLCDRRRGIGADGLISGRAPDTSQATATVTVTTSTGTAADRHDVAADVAPDVVPDVTMVLRNADGSRAEMSGNGIRCLAQAVLRRRGETSGIVTIATDAGLRCVTVTARDRASVSLAEVDLGPARPGPDWDGRVPAGLIDALGTAALRFETVDLGNPHLVIEAVDPAAVDLAHFGPLLEAAFPRGVNVEVVGPRAGCSDEIDVVVWERGVGLTDACGTGACASAAAASRWGLVGSDVTVHLPGGPVSVLLGPTLTLRGDVVHIADIEVDLDIGQDVGQDVGQDGHQDVEPDIGPGVVAGVEAAQVIGVPSGRGRDEDGTRDDGEDMGG